MSDNYELEYQKIVENVYKQYSYTSCLDGVEGIDYICTEDVGTINLCHLQDKYGMSDINRGFVPEIDKSILNKGLWCFHNERGRRLHLPFGWEVNEKIIEQYVRSCIIPELDAYRFAYISYDLYSTKENDINKAYEKILIKEPNVLTFISDKANCKLDYDIRSTFVPQECFYNCIDLMDGISETEKQGGFEKHKKCSDDDIDEGKNLKYLMFDKTNFLTVTKLVVKEQENDFYDFIVYHDIFRKNTDKDRVFVGLEED